MTRYVLLGDVPNPNGYHLLQAAPPGPDVLPDRLFDGAPAPSRLRVQAVSYGGGRKQPWRALGVLGHTGALIVSEDAAAALGPLAAGAEPVTFSKGKGKPFEGGYVRVPVPAMRPLDRAAARLTTRGGGDPWRERVERIEELAWRADRDLPPWFRLVDDPRCVVAREDVAAALVDATHGDVRVADPAARCLLDDNEESLPVALDVATARAAEEAYWAALAGGPGREEALAHPLFACAVAASIDGGPRDDTRAAACRDPSWAAWYALHLDRCQREDTREAAERDHDGALLYATTVELRVRDEVAAKLLERVGWWDAPSVANLASSVEQRRRDARGSAGPARVATRELPPTPTSPQFALAEDLGGGRHAPLSPDLSADVEAFTAAGYADLALPADAPPPDVMDALFARIEAIRAGEVKLPAGKRAADARLALACVLGDVWHRAFGWSWAQVEAPWSGVALVSPDRAHALVPLAPITRWAKKGGPANTSALLFNLVAAGELPPSAPGRYTTVS